MSRYPYFQVLSYSDPKQRRKWRAICNNFSDIDIFYYPEYAYLFELKGDGKAQCFVYYDKHGIVMYPFLRRDINKVITLNDLPSNLVDISSPYGYSGYLRNNDRIDMDIFYDTFNNYCNENNIVSEFVRFHPLLNNSIYSPTAVERRKLSETVVVDLTLPPDEIWGKLTSACRNKVRKARKSGVEVIHDELFENIARFHELYNDTMQRLEARNYYLLSLDWFYILIKLLKGNVALFNAQYKNNIVMSGLFLFTGRFIHYYLSGSDYEMSHTAANNLLLYEVALWAKNRGIESFHLGGGFQPQDNLFKFKASFSPKRAEFFIGNMVHSVEIYDDLCRKKWATRERQAVDENFFPAYRAPEKKSGISSGVKSFVTRKRKMKNGKTFNVLFTNVGRRVSLIQAFRRAMGELEISGQIFGVDANPLSPAYHITDHSLTICHIQDDDYIPSLLDICHDKKINLLISLLDTDLVKLSESREIFNEYGTFILISSPEVVRMARDKYLTRDFFRENSIPTPKILSYEEALSQNRFPLFIKPKDGSASLLTFRVDDLKTLEFFSSYVPSPLVQEFVQGDEYTLDIFIDIQGKIRALVPRKRLEVRAGEVSKSQIVLDPRILDAGRRVGEALSRKGGLGPINAQCIYNPDGEVKFIEINPRFGGGTPLSLQAGYPFAKWSIEMALNKDLSPLPSDLGEGLIMLRYDEAIFIRQTQGQE